MKLKNKLPIRGKVMPDDNTVSSKRQKNVKPLKKVNKVPKMAQERTAENNSDSGKVKVSSEIELASRLAQMSLNYEYVDGALPYILYLLQLADESDFFDIEPVINKDSSVVQQDVSDFISYLLPPIENDKSAEISSVEPDVTEQEVTSVSGGIEVEVL